VNNSVNMASDTTVLTALHDLAERCCSRSDIPRVLAANDTISMEPSASTRPRLAARLVTGQAPSSLTREKRFARIAIATAWPMPLSPS
jgi:hypothetical protein